MSVFEKFKKQQQEVDIVFVRTKGQDEKYDIIYFDGQQKNEKESKDTLSKKEHKTDQYKFHIHHSDIKLYVNFPLYGVMYYLCYYYQIDMKNLKIIDKKWSNKKVEQINLFDRLSTQGLSDTLFINFSINDNVTQIRTQQSDMYLQLFNELFEIFQKVSLIITPHYTYNVLEYTYQSSQLSDDMYQHIFNTTSTGAIMGEQYVSMVQFKHVMKGRLNYPKKFYNIFPFQEAVFAIQIITNQWICTCVQYYQVMKLYIYKPSQKQERNNSVFDLKQQKYDTVEQMQSRYGKILNNELMTSLKLIFPEMSKILLQPHTVDYQILFTINDIKYTDKQFEQQVRKMEKFTKVRKTHGVQFYVTGVKSASHVSSVNMKEDPDSYDVQQFMRYLKLNEPMSKVQYLKKFEQLQITIKTPNPLEAFVNLEILCDVIGVRKQLQTILINDFKTDQDLFNYANCIQEQPINIDDPNKIGTIAFDMTFQQDNQQTLNMLNAYDPRLFGKDDVLQYDKLIDKLQKKPQILEILNQYDQFSIVQDEQDKKDIEDFYKNKEKYLGKETLEKWKEQNIKDPLQFLQNKQKYDIYGGEKGDVTYENYDINSDQFLKYQQLLMIYGLETMNTTFTNQWNVYRCNQDYPYMKPSSTSGRSILSCQKHKTNIDGGIEILDYHYSLNNLKSRDRLFSDYIQQFTYGRVSSSNLRFSENIPGGRCCSLPKNLLKIFGADHFYLLNYVNSERLYYSTLSKFDSFVIYDHNQNRLFMQHPLGKHPIMIIRMNTKKQYVVMLRHLLKVTLPTPSDSKFTKKKDKYFYQLYGFDIKTQMVVKQFSLQWYNDQKLKLLAIQKTPFQNYVHTNKGIFPYVGWDYYDNGYKQIEEKYLPLKLPSIDDDIIQQIIERGDIYYKNIDEQIIGIGYNGLDFYFKEAAIKLSDKEISYSTYPVFENIQVDGERSSYDQLDLRFSKQQLSYYMLFGQQGKMQFDVSLGNLYDFIIQKQNIRKKISVYYDQIDVEKYITNNFVSRQYGQYLISIYQGNVDDISKDVQQYYEYNPPLGESNGDRQKLTKNMKVDYNFNPLYEQLVFLNRQKYLSIDQEAIEKIDFKL